MLASDRFAFKFPPDKKCNLVTTKYAKSIDKLTKCFDLSVYKILVKDVNAVEDLSHSNQKQTHYVLLQKRN